MEQEVEQVIEILDTSIQLPPNELPEGETVEPRRNQLQAAMEPPEQATKASTLPTPSPTVSQELTPIAEPALPLTEPAHTGLSQINIAP